MAVSSLVDPRRRRVGRVDGLLVADQRQRHDAVVVGQQLRQRRQMQPEVIGVEVLIAADILEFLRLLRRTLRRLAQDELTIRLLRQVAALAVSGGARRHLHQEGDAIGGEVAENGEIERRTQVVGVAHEDSFVARGEHLLQHAAGDQRRVDVAVTGGTPRLLRVGGPRRRLQRLFPDLWLLVLDKIQRHILDKIGVTGKGVQCRRACGKAVHQHQRQPRTGRLAQMAHLLHDDVQEGAPFLHHEQRLGAVHAHAGAQPAVELEHDGAIQRSAPRGDFGAAQVGIVGHSLDRPGDAVVDVARRAGHQLLVIELERVDKNLRQLGRTHCLGKRCKVNIDCARIHHWTPIWCNDSICKTDKITSQFRVHNSEFKIVNCEL
jgi:hypothetical protein